MFHWGGFVGFGGSPGPSATWTRAGLGGLVVDRGGSPGPSATWTRAGLGGLVVGRGGRPGPSATWTTAGLDGLVVGLGGSPGPSARATEPNDMSNNANARIRFIIILLGGECPGNSLDGGRGFLA